LLSERKKREKSQMKKRNRGREGGRGEERMDKGTII
jgi:hypothetical protein